MSRSSRGAFRRLMTDVPVGEIQHAFQDEGFAPNPKCAFQDSSVRRVTTEEYLSGIKWADRAKWPSLSRVLERLLAGVLPTGTYRTNWDGFVRQMELDGWTVNDQGHISGIYDPVGLSPESIAQVADPEALYEHLDRLRRAVGDADPALVIGSAKELVESTAKLILAKLDVQWNDRNDDLPDLIGKAHEALGLHPGKSVGPDGSKPVKRVLGGLTSVVLGLGELRNQYGTGHGPGAKRVGLQDRHARLAVGSAITWCELVLDTLADPRAPWRETANVRG